MADQTVWTGGDFSDYDWTSSVSKAALTGVVAAVAAFLLTDEADATILGVNIPVPIILGVGGAAGSVVADVAHQWAFPFMHDMKYDHAEAVALSVLSSSVGFYLAGALVHDAPTPMSSLIIGAGSYIASDYIWLQFIADPSGKLVW